MERPRKVFLSGTASRIIFPVPSKRQKFTIIELCPFDNLGHSSLLENLAKCFLGVLGLVIFTLSNTCNPISNIFG